MVDSLILTDEVHMQYFHKELADSKNLELIYRGSDDGFDAVDFHRKCDNQGGTISVI